MHQEFLSPSVALRAQPSTEWHQESCATGSMTVTRCDKESGTPALCDFALLLIILVAQVCFLTPSLHQIEFIHNLQLIIKNNSCSVNKKFAKVCMEGRKALLSLVK